MAVAGAVAARLSDELALVMKAAKIIAGLPLLNLEWGVEEGPAFRGRSS